jgi:UDP-glucose:(heptosyl)LPS alpha-1,3-glucosyltransferase
VKLAVICRPFSFHGGVETATAGLIGELARRGHAVDLVSTRAQPDVPGITVRRLAVPAQPPTLRFLWFALAARRAVRRAAYDVVQSHERCLSQDIYRAGEGTHVGYLEAMGRRGRPLDPHHRLVLAVERRIFTLRAARHVVAISRRDAGDIARRFGTPPAHRSVVYNGVDLARFHPDLRRRWRGPTRGELGLSDSQWVVLFLGSGFARKGLGPLLDGAAALGDPGVRIVVAGKGDTAPYERRAARLGLERRVSWLGARVDAERLYAMADAVALPARYEPFGNVHLEALASGLPILTSIWAGGAEVVTHGKNGWVVPSLDAPDVSAGLAGLRELDPRETAAAARAAAEPFTYAAQVEALTRLYAGLAGSADLARTPDAN